MTERETNLVKTVRVSRTILRNKWKFLAFFILVFLIFVWILGRLDLLPEPDTSRGLSTITIAQASDSFPAVAVAAVETKENPVRIVIDSANVDVVVNNPIATDIPSLDNSLLSGVARYPASAKLGESGNVIIFGHSSYLPIVKNKNFKAFNGIQNLVKGKIIKVYGEDFVYEYAVERVYPTNQEDVNTIVTAVGSEKILTLITTRISGDQPLDKYVVRAKFVGSTEVSS